MGLVLGLDDFLEVVIDLMPGRAVDVLREERLQALDTPRQLHILVVHRPGYDRHILAYHVGNLLLAQGLEVPLVTAREIVMLALDDGAHRVEQRLLPLLEHLDEHAGTLVGILNLLLLLGLLHRHGIGTLVALIHHGITLTDLQCGDIVAQRDRQAAIFLIDLDVKIGGHLLAAVSA